MPKTTEVPVLIVGGGAVGCVLSMELARRGIEYRCIDRMPGPGRETRAIAMHARTVELLDLVDKELSQRILEREVGLRTAHGSQKNPQPDQQQRSPERSEPRGNHDPSVDRR